MGAAESLSLRTRATPGVSEEIVPDLSDCITPPLRSSPNAGASTPEIARGLKEAAPAETAALRKAIELWMPAYHLAFEERQVHYGENFIDIPDTLHGIFRAHALLWD